MFAAAEPLHALVSLLSIKRRERGDYSPTRLARVAQTTISSMKTRLPPLVWREPTDEIIFDTRNLANKSNNDATSCHSSSCAIIKLHTLPTPGQILTAKAMGKISQFEYLTLESEDFGNILMLRASP
jgi:hypothetical protein